MYVLLLLILSLSCKDQYNYSKEPFIKEKAKTKPIKTTNKALNTDLTEKKLPIIEKDEKGMIKFNKPKPIIPPEKVEKIEEDLNQEPPETPEDFNQDSRIEEPEDFNQDTFENDILD